MGLWNVTDMEQVNVELTLFSPSRWWLELGDGQLRWVVA